MSANRYLLARGRATALRLMLPAFGRVSIGRSAENDVVIGEPGIEERHLLLHVDFGIGVEIAGDAEITVVDPSGRRQTHSRGTIDLEPGQKVIAGAIELRFETAEEPRLVRHLWARPALEKRRTPDAQVLVFEIEGGDAAPIFFEMLRAEESAADLGGGRYAVLSALGKQRIDELAGALVRRFQTAGVRVIGWRALDADEKLDAELTPAPLPIEEASTDPQGNLRDEIAALERRRILEALEKYPNQADAAKALGIPIRTFANRMDALGIPRKRTSKGKS